MVWTETHLKVIKTLIPCDSKAQSVIAREIGFSSPNNIRTHLDYLERNKYITQVSNSKIDPHYRIVRDVNRVLVMYNNHHYQSIQEEIRSMGWFLFELTQKYQTIPEDIYKILMDMARKSPTFFDNLIFSRSPDDFRERFRFMLYPFTFIPGMNTNWEIPLLMYQLYAEAIARDMKGGRLEKGFCEPLKEMRELLNEIIREDEN